LQAYDIKRKNKGNNKSKETGDNCKENTKARDRQKEIGRDKNEKLDHICTFRFALGKIVDGKQSHSAHLVSLVDCSHTSEY
jgi:hypothetical protein